MATQIAPTPVVRGKQAEEILRLAKKQSTERTRKASENLIKYFEPSKKYDKELSQIKI